MDKIKLGVIGLGSMGKRHMYNCLKLQGAQLTAVADVSKKALKSATKLGVEKVYKDYKELLNDSGVDAVIIALPTHLHVECAQAAAKCNKHILLEKPLARSTTEGKQMLDVVKKHNVKLCVGYPLRFSVPCQKLKARIDSGELGEIQIAYATNVGTGPFVHRAAFNAPVPVPEWWWNKELTGGGALIDLGSHMINITRWLFGEVDEAKSYLGYRFNMNQEDHAVCLLRFNSGPVCIITVGWFSQKFKSEILVLGTADSATTAQKPPSRIKTALELFLRKPLKSNMPFIEEVNQFVRCIQHDEPPKTSGEEALKDLEVIEQAYANQVGLADIKK